MSFSNIPESTISSLIAKIKKELDFTGIYYRLFYRIKENQSLESKINKKIQEKGDTYKLQDLIGVRIVLYFLDDIEICDALIKENFQVDITNSNITIPNKNTFQAVVHNYVCALPEDTVELIGNSVFEENHIDKTFEIQLRTVFSEGWHEIEHDLRYKMKDAWKKHEESERTLNGIMATLETCNWSILALLDNLTYQNYKSAEWEYMIKNKFRIHFSDKPIKAELIKILNNPKTELAKSILKIDRSDVLKEFRKGIPFDLNNLIFIVIYLKQMDKLYEIPEPIKLKLEKSLC